MSTIELTQEKFNRTASDLNKMAGEAVTVEFYSGAFWVFGSEIAILRLLKQYRETNLARADYSKNLQTHYFRLEVPMFCGEFRFPSQSSWPEQ